MTSKFLIYGLVDPRTDAVRYIGKSCSGISRPKVHSMSSSLQQRGHKVNWVRSLVALNLKPTIRVLEEFSAVADLNDAECFWIAQGRGLGWPLTNLTKGGEGTTGCIVSAETRAKLAAAMTPEIRAKFAAALMGHEV